MFTFTLPDWMVHTIRRSIKQSSTWIAESYRWHGPRQKWRRRLEIVWCGVVLSAADISWGIRWEEEEARVCYVQVPPLHVTLSDDTMYLETSYSMAFWRVSATAMTIIILPTYAIRNCFLANNCRKPTNVCFFFRQLSFVEILNTAHNHLHTNTAILT